MHRGTARGMTPWYDAAMLRMLNYRANARGSERRTREDVRREVRHTCARLGWLIAAAALCGALGMLTMARWLLLPLLVLMLITAWMPLAIIDAVIRLH